MVGGMTKRLIAAYLWIAALWTMGSIAEEALGLPDTVGLLLGIAAAIAIVAMPAGLWTRRVLPVSREPRSVESLPAGITPTH
jgi:hypothetical protein